MEKSSPRVFISYAWSSLDHENWVLHLAQRLVHDGVDVVLDKWDLQAGQDSIAFMEQMVSNDSIKKVIMIFDKKYVHKSDARLGGVGTESQIITPEIYNKSNQSRFAAVIAERDENGDPYIPVYYKSRIYFDLNSIDSYEDQYDSLIRWIYEKPLHVKPKLGLAPSYIFESRAQSSTFSSHKRLESSIKDGSKLIKPNIIEFKEVLEQSLESHRVNFDSESAHDDVVISKINEMSDYYTQITSLFILASRHDIESKYFDELLNIFEVLAEFINYRSESHTRTNFDLDAYKFIAHKIFVSSFALLLKEGDYDRAHALVSRKFYIPNVSSSGGSDLVDFTYFYNHLDSLRYRNNRLRLNRTSIHADLLKDQLNSSQLSFARFIQSDILLALRDQSIMMKKDFDYNSWYPLTSIFVNQWNQMEVFVKAKEDNIRSKVFKIIDVSSVDELKELISRIKNSYRGDQFARLNLTNMLNVDGIGH